MEYTITHPGIVNRITDKGIEISILVQESCVSCQAKSVCQIADQKEKVMLIDTSSEKFRPGEKVVIEMKESRGMQAVLIAYILPVVLLIIAMVPGIILKIAEGWLAFSGLAAVVLYFSLLYFLRDRLKKQFSFRVKKQGL